MSETRSEKSSASIVGFAVLLVSFALGGCPEEDAAPEDAGDPAHPAAECPASTPETAIGLIAEGENGLMQAELLEADYLPPIVSPNHWVIQLQDLDGNPIDDATLEVKLFMPVHNHDGLREPQVTDLGDGKFDLLDMNLWMLGPWEIQLMVNGDEDYIVFHTCTE